MSNRLEVNSVNIDKELEGEETFGTGTVRKSNVRRRLKRKSKRCDACISYLAIQLAGIGFFLSISSTVICKYFSVSGAEDEENNSGGIWSIPRGNETNTFLSCEAYPSGSSFDIYFRTARAMSVLAPILCLIGMTTAYFAEAGPPAKQECRLLISIVFSLGASAMQGLTLMILESAVCVENPNMPGDGSCLLSYGSRISIGSASFMGAATFALLVTGRKQLEYDSNNPSTHNDPSMHERWVSMHPPQSHPDGYPAGIEHDLANDEHTKEPSLPIRHGTGRFKFVDIWGKMV